MESVFYSALCPFRFSISENSSDIFSRNFFRNFVRNFDVLENIPVQIKSVTSEKELSQIDQTWDLGCFIIFVAITVLNENFHTTEIFVTTSTDPISGPFDPILGHCDPISGPRPISGTFGNVRTKVRVDILTKLPWKSFYEIIKDYFLCLIFRIFCDPFM